MTEETIGRRGRGEGRRQNNHEGMGRGEGHGPRHRSGRHSLLSVRLVEPALLILLAEEARHGYTLLEELEKFGLKDLHPSKVYRTLRMMESDEWIVSDWDADETQGPPRRVYRLTAEGKDVLRFWQNRLEDYQMVVKNILTRLQLQSGDAQE